MALGRRLPSMAFPYNIDSTNNNNHQYKSVSITFLVTQYNTIKLVISKYPPYIHFVMTSELYMRLIVSAIQN